VPFRHRRLIGENIRTFRKRAGLSQETLAEKAELNPKYVSEVERGRVNISLDALTRISEGLKVRVAELLRGV